MLDAEALLIQRFAEALASQCQRHRASSLFNIWQLVGIGEYDKM